MNTLFQSLMDDKPSKDNRFHFLSWEGLCLPEKISVPGLETTWRHGPSFKPGPKFLDYDSYPASCLSSLYLIYISISNHPVLSKHMPSQAEKDVHWSACKELCPFLPSDGIETHPRDSMSGMLATWKQRTHSGYVLNKKDILPPVSAQIKAFTYRVNLRAGPELLIIPSPPTERLSCP